MKKTNQSEADKWETIWTRYIEALKVLDKPIKGANARCAQARLAKAENAIRDYDPEFYQKHILVQPSVDHRDAMGAWFRKR